jgi:soluble lytic murein transglycosylase
MPGLAYDRFIWRMKKDLYDEATELILERSTSAESLGRPEAWAERRAMLARYLMRNGRAEEPTGWRQTTIWQTDSGASAYADLEFLSGFIALRRLNDPTTGAEAFQAPAGGGQNPDQPGAGALLDRSRARGGRAGRHGQLSRRRRCIRRPSTGLLAAEQLGLSLDARLLAKPKTPDWRGAGYAQSSVLAAAQLLLKAGDRTLAKRFLLHLAESQDETGLAQMADMALDWGEPHLAVLIAKQAAERGLILPHAYYPVPDFVPDGLKVSRALALSISRRESEFDPAARSSADARGLMQVLPGTAKHMADKLGKPFDAAS